MWYKFRFASVTVRHELHANREGNNHFSWICGHNRLFSLVGIFGRYERSQADHEANTAYFNYMHRFIHIDEKRLALRSAPIPNWSIVSQLFLSVI